MSRHFPLVFGTLQLGLVGAATYLLCSASVLTEASLFLVR